MVAVAIGVSIVVATVVPVSVVVVIVVVISVIMVAIALGRVGLVEVVKDGINSFHLLYNRVALFSVNEIIHEEDDER